MDNQNLQGGYQQGQPYQNPNVQQGQPYQNPNVQQGQPYQDPNVQQSQPYQDPNAQQGGFQQPYGYPPQGPRQSSSGLAKGSLICGIASIAFLLIHSLNGGAFGAAALSVLPGLPNGAMVTAVLGIIAGVIGFILGYIAKKGGDTSGIMTAGFFMSLVGLIACLVAVIAAAVVGSMMKSAAGNILGGLGGLFGGSSGLGGLEDLLDGLY